MEIEVVTADEQMTWLKLTGRLDTQGVTEQEQTFMEFTVGRGKPVIVDIEEVPLLVSLAVRMLLRAAKELNAQGQRIALLQPKPLVKDVLEKAGLASFFAICNDESEALIALGLWSEKA